MKAMDTANNSVKGNYYIRVRPTGWFLWFQYYEAGKRRQERVSEDVAAGLGFRKEWSNDQAKAHCKRLNAERSLIKEKIRVAGKRVETLRSLDATLFPQARIDAFKLRLEEENFGSEKHLEKLISHFNFIQKMCLELRILPQEYKESAKRIYKYFIKAKISTNYSFRIIALLNRYGRFASKEMGSFYEDLTMPKGRELSAIADAQKTKSGVNSELGVREASLPLTPENLKNNSNKVSIEHYNWLYLSVWLGLRPEEVDGLKNQKRYRIEFNLKTKLTILHVYQTKLQSVAEDKRWKQIPIIFKEQHVAITIIKEGAFKRPLAKTVQKHFGQGITLYGGRKNFVDMMIAKGQTLENISLWLGHKDISTTWVSYKDREAVNFTATPETVIKAK